MSSLPSGCFLIAEAGVNHNGDVGMAEKLINAAAEAGADAVKFQTFTADALVTRNAESTDYQRRNTGGTYQHEMLKSLELSCDDFRRLKGHCEKRGILFLSSPFDEGSARFLLEDLKMERIKIPSGEITHLPFLKYLTSFGRPLILSTGMSDLPEIQQAVEAIRSVSKDAALTLLHCTSNYPCLFEETNLKAMRTLSETFSLPVGYSDHTLGIEIAIAAAALEATVIEKHFTLDRGLPGPDHPCSLEPRELKQLVLSVRNVEKALGSPEKRPMPSELQTRQKVRKSLVLARNLPAGSVLTEKDLAAKRPGDGISPAHLNRLVGKRLMVDKAADERIAWSDVDPEDLG